MSNMKCPFCQQELETGNYYVHCHNPHCNITVDMDGTEELREALIRTRKALYLAFEMLKDIKSDPDTNDELTQEIADRLSEIETALEQKD